MTVTSGQCRVHSWVCGSRPRREKSLTSVTWMITVLAAWKLVAMHHSSTFDWLGLNMVKVVFGWNRSLQSQVQITARVTRHFFIEEDREEMKMNKICRQKLGRQNPEHKAKHVDLQSALLPVQIGSLDSQLTGSWFLGTAPWKNRKLILLAVSNSRESNYC